MLWYVILCCVVLCYVMLRYVIVSRSDPFEEFLVWVGERIFIAKRGGAAVSFRTPKSTEDLDLNVRRCDSLTSRKDSILHCVPSLLSDL